MIDSWVCCLLDFRGCDFGVVLMGNRNRVEIVIWFILLIIEILDVIDVVRVNLIVIVVI